MASDERSHRPTPSSTTGLTVLHTGRTRFAEEKKKRLKSMCAEAKKVEELWDDQGAAFYYYDRSKNQSFHEPPKTGYKRRDELLVLATGEAVEDPDHVLNDQQQAANAAADAAKLLFGLYSEKASKPMEELQGFLQVGWPWAAPRRMLGWCRTNASTRLVARSRRCRTNYITLAG